MQSLGVNNKMKREIFLSFRPEFFRPILYGIKKYEYRKRFCQEPVTAYLYLSSTVREVIGVMELGEPLIIKDLINDIDKKTIAYSRLEECLENGEQYAIPIESLSLYKKPISIEEIKKIESSFHVPQSYLYIRKFSNLYNNLKDQEFYPKEFINSHNELYMDNLGCSCKEMETLEEFKLLDKMYLKNKKYDIVKAGYILRRSI